MRFIVVVVMLAACGSGGGSHPPDALLPDAMADASSSAKELTSFAFLAADNSALAADITASIAPNTIAATVPFGTNVTALTATFATTGSAVSVGSTTQVSGATSNNFENPVVYRVTAADGSTDDYVVTVTIALSAAKDITALSFLAADNSAIAMDVSASIVGTEITASVPFTTDVSALTPTFSTTGTSVVVGTTPQLSGVTVNNFKSPLTYRVTAADSSTKDYTVRVTTPSTYLKASNPGMNDYFGWNIALSADGTTVAVGAYGEAGSGDTAQDSGAVYVFVRSGSTWVHQALLKASNYDAQDRFGFAVSLSADGNTLAVGAYQEASVATGIGGNQADNTAPESGAVYVFTRSGTDWTQQAYIKASNSSAIIRFGYSLALAGDGNMLAVGAPLELSGATGIDGDQTDKSQGFAGAVYVFTRSGITWTQQAYVKASNTYSKDLFGSSVALSADATTLAVGAIEEDSAATGIDGDQSNDGATKAGAVYVFTRGATWSQQAYVKASNTALTDYFGTSLALSANGNTLVVGVPDEDSAATGIGGNQSDNSAGNAGAVYVFARASAIWAQQAYVKASNTDLGDAFGRSVALSADGNRLAVGAVLEDSAATGVHGNQTDNSIDASGAVYLFARSGTSWSQDAYVKAPNPGQVDRFGDAVPLSADGRTLAVGARSEASAATGVNGNQNDNSVANAGAVYVFE